jgi:hypothetical protein
VIGARARQSGFPERAAGFFQRSVSPLLKPISSSIFRPNQPVRAFPPIPGIIPNFHRCFERQTTPQGAKEARRQMNCDNITHLASQTETEKPLHPIWTFFVLEDILNSYKEAGLNDAAGILQDAIHQLEAVVLDPAIRPDIRPVSDIRLSPQNGEQS